MKTLDRIGRFLRDAYGFDMSRPGMESLERIVRERCAITGISTLEEYLQLVEGSAVEQDLLVDNLVISETFFFRYPDSFAALVEWAKVHAKFPLRVLSAACSTGEEAYSLAMCLLDAGFAPGDLHIEGCDASAASVQVAQRGLYQRKAFRSGDQPWLHAYFSESAEGRTVVPMLREMVHFRQGNLLNLGGREEWDVIFCRNALIYFTAEQQARVAEGLRRLLADEGILFLGPAEPPVFFASGWSPSGYPMSFSVVKSSVPVPRPHTPVLLHPTPKKPPMIRSEPVPARSIRERVAEKMPAGIERAGALADEGRLEEAQRLLDDILRDDAQNSEAHFLCGIVAEAQRQDAVAESHYRKALYLSPGHEEALQHMALLLQGQGRTEAAENFIRRATRHHAQP